MWNFFFDKKKRLNIRRHCYSTNDDVEFFLILQFAVVRIALESVINLFHREILLHSFRLNGQT